MLPEYDYINDEFPEGVGVVLNSSYAVEQTIPVFEPPETFDMHEFNILRDGNTALIITRHPQFYSNSTEAGMSRGGWVDYNHFWDYDIAANKLRFHWSTEDHIPVSESYSVPPSGWGPPDVLWDYL